MKIFKVFTIVIYGKTAPVPGGHVLFKPMDMAWRNLIMEITNEHFYKIIWKSANLYGRRRIFKCLGCHRNQNFEWSQEHVNQTCRRIKYRCSAINYNQYQYLINSSTPTVSGSVFTCFQLCLMASFSWVVSPVAPPWSLTPEHGMLEYSVINSTLLETRVMVDRYITVS